MKIIKTKNLKNNFIDMTKIRFRFAKKT